MVCDECLNKGGVKCAHCPRVLCPKHGRRVDDDLCKLCSKPVCLECNEDYEDDPPCQNTGFNCGWCRINQSEQAHKSKDGFCGSYCENRADEQGWSYLDPDVKF